MIMSISTYMSWAFCFTQETPLPLSPQPQPPWSPCPYLPTVISSYPVTPLLLILVPSCSLPGLCLVVWARVTGLAGSFGPRIGCKGTSVHSSASLELPWQVMKARNTDEVMAPRAPGGLDRRMLSADTAATS